MDKVFDLKHKKRTKKEDILDAGIRLFARVPFTEMTIAAVAREANCGHSLVYHYFKNINDLYDSGVTYVSNRFLTIVNRLSTLSAPPELVFVGIISHLVEVLKTQKMPVYYINLVVYRHAKTPKNSILIKLQDEWTHQIINIIRKGQKNNQIITFMTPEEIMQSLLTMFQGIVSSQILSVDEFRNNFKASNIYLPYLKGVH